MNTNRHPGRRAPAAAVLAILLATAPPAASAQSAPSCPQLPADAGPPLHWESQATGDAVLCRAVAPDGSEAFGLYLTDTATFEPSRGNRREAGTLDGRPMYWYRAEIASAPGIEAREALVQLGDGRYVHAWLQADSAPALAARLRRVSGLHFGAPAPAASGD